MCVHLLRFIGTRSKSRKCPTGWAEHEDHSVPKFNRFSFSVPTEQLTQNSCMLSQRSDTDLERAKTQSVRSGRRHLSRAHSLKYLVDSADLLFQKLDQVWLWWKDGWKKYFLGCRPSTEAIRRGASSVFGRSEPEPAPWGTVFLIFHSYFCPSSYKHKQCGLRSYIERTLHILRTR